MIIKELGGVWSVFANQENKPIGSHDGAVEGAALLQSDYRPWVCGHGFAAMGSRRPSAPLFTNDAAGGGERVPTRTCRVPRVRESLRARRCKCGRDRAA